MQAHGVKSQTALQYRMESSLHWAQGHVSFPGCLGTEGLLPGWDVLLLEGFHPGVTALPQTKDEEEALQSQALHSLSSWVLSRSVRYQPSGRSYR